MPIAFARRLTGRSRSPEADRHLGYALAFIAGGINAGGFVAVHQYTSHMTGVASSLSNSVASGAWSLAGGSLASLLSFAAGATCCTLFIRGARRRRMHSEYALPLLLEALLLLAFGLTGGRVGTHDAVPLAAKVALLCFIMGLQNALITKLSRAEIRTTHVTGIVTDIGIELGRRIADRADAAPANAAAAGDSKLRLLIALFVAFILGGIAGTAAFRVVGDLATIPLAAMLIACALVPLADDARDWHAARRASD